MYIKGLPKNLRGLGDAEDALNTDWGWGEAAPGAGDNSEFAWGDAPYTPSTGGTPVASDAGVTSSWDWNGLVKTAMTAYGNIVGNKNAPPAPPTVARVPVSPVSSPFTGGMGNAGVLFLLLGGAALAAVALRK